MPTTELKGKPPVILYDTENKYYSAYLRGYNKGLYLGGMIGAFSVILVLGIVWTYLQYG
jgi:hypothetical protein